MLTQVDLALPGEPLTAADVRAVTTMSKAIRESIARSGLPEKAIYTDLDIDKGQWSRILAGGAHFPHEKFLRLANLTRNDLPALWLLDRRGWDITTLRPQESELERQLRIEREKRAALEHENAVLIKAIRGA